MTNVLICSDSHGDVASLEKAVEIFKPDRIVHLGDHSEDADHIQNRFFYLPVISVAGNCDRYSAAPLSAKFELDGVRFFGCHGHRYQVKSGLMQLYYAALEAGANVCLFGHTHTAFAGEESGILFLNPGACSGANASVCLLTVNDGKISYSFKSVGE